MKKYFPLLLIVLFSALCLGAQIPRPSASPPTPAEDADVVKITTSLIQVDVTVTDSRGNIIRDLRPEEIEIYENGKKQKISNLSFVSNVRETAEQEAPVNRTAPNVPVAPLRQEQVRRTVALVVDDLTLSFESTYYVRRALKKYVDEQMREGDLVAIIRTGAGIGALQQFTSDKRMLYAAIEKIRWNPNGTGRIGAFAPLEAKPPTEPTPEPEPGERTAEGQQREFDDFRSNYFVTGTLGAVNYVVRGMAELPGRKSIMLLSDGFRMFNRDASGTVETSRIMESLRRLVDQANRSSVVIYTLDPRGLQVTGLTAADNTSGRSMEEIREAESERGNELSETQDGLRYLARQTGGFAFINNNDLSGGIRRVLDDQSYYLVAYEPEEETFDPKTRRFNRLDVRVLRKGARTRYRSGFFGVSDDAVTAANRSSRGDIMHAITSPFAVNEVNVRLNSLFGVHPKAGSHLRSLLHVPATDITFADGPNESKIAKFDVVAVAFGDNGIPVDSLARSYTLTVEKKKYESLSKTGFVYDFAFPIKKPGAYQLRIAIKDNATNRIGSASQFVDVPNLKKNRLTLTGAGLENISMQLWEKRAANPNLTDTGDTDPLMDTSLRRFKRGTILSFALSVYNAKTGSGGVALSSQVRLFRDGAVVYEGPLRPFTPTAAPDGSSVFMSSLSLAASMATGDYALQVEITDNNAKGKYKTATQFIQFEIVE